MQVMFYFSLWRILVVLENDWKRSSFLLVILTL